MQAGRCQRGAWRGRPRTAFFSFSLFLRHLANTTTGSALRSIPLLAGLAQDSYETPHPGRTAQQPDSSRHEELYPSVHGWHETVEITHGFNDWFETAFYIFTSAQPGYGWQWVGNHMR